MRNPSAALSTQTYESAFSTFSADPSPDDFHDALQAINDEKLRSARSSLEPASGRMGLGSPKGKAPLAALPPEVKLERLSAAISEALENPDQIQAGRDAMELIFDSVGELDRQSFLDEPSSAGRLQLNYLDALAESSDLTKMGVAGIVAFTARALASGIGLGVIKTFVESGFEQLFKAAEITNPAAQAVIMAPVVGVVVGIGMLALDQTMFRGGKAAGGAQQVPTDAATEEQKSRFLPGKLGGSAVAIGATGLVGLAMTALVKDPEAVKIMTTVVGAGTGALAATAFNFMLSSRNAEGEEAPAFKVAISDEPLGQRFKSAAIEGFRTANEATDAKGRVVEGAEPYAGIIHDAVLYMGGVAQGELLKQLILAQIDTSTPYGKIAAGGLGPALVLASYYANTGANAPRAGRGKPFGALKKMVDRNLTRLHIKSSKPAVVDAREANEAASQLQRFADYLTSGAVQTHEVGGDLLRAPVVIAADATVALWSAGARAARNRTARPSQDIELQAR